MALLPGLAKAASQDWRMPRGRVSRGQARRASYTNWGMLICMGQLATQRMHILHCHTQGVRVTSSSMPNEAMRTNLRGSISSSPVAGHEAEQAPQDRHIEK